MNRLRDAAIATGCFAAFAYGSIKLDEANTNRMDDADIRCYQKAPEQSTACVKAVNENQGTQPIILEAVGVLSVAGAAVSGAVVVRNLRAVKE